MGNFGTLWSWAWSNVGQWFIIFVVLGLMIKEAKNHAWGKMVGVLLIGGVIWCFGTGPTHVLSGIASIAQKVMGG